MAYKVKTRNEFNAYLNTIEVLPTSDEMLIDKFDSFSLFDLYELLMDIKDDSQISSAMQEKLKKTIAKNFSEEIASSLSFPVTNSVIQKLEGYIKDVFLSYIDHPEKFAMTKDKVKEMENLKIIMAKKYPHELLKYIKEEKKSSELQLETQFIEKTVIDAVDKYCQQTEKMQNNEDIQTAHYTTSKNKFPEVHNSPTGRKKSPQSTIANFEKEIRKSLDKVVPSNLEKGITYSDLEKNFNLDKAIDDYYGYTVYVTDIDDTFHIDKETKATEDGKLFIEYRKQKNDNIDEYHSLYDFLDDPYSLLDFTQEQYLQMKIELLAKLQDLTFPECSEEYIGPLFQREGEEDSGTSFSKLLESSLTEYFAHLEADDFKQNLTDDEHAKYHDELDSLLVEFKNRIYDKYEFQALKIIIPKILKDKNFLEENVLRDQLEVKLLSSKIRFKRNGFCSIYAIIHTPDGKRIEVQFQTNMRYKDSKIGSSDHSRMYNKQLDISHFFELKDKFKKSMNYSTLLKNYIHILDTTTIAERNRLLATPIESLTSEQRRKRRDLEFAQKSIQIKENYEDIHLERDGSIGQITKYTLEEYLPMFAQYHSPELVSVSSAHSRVNQNTAFVNRKTLIDNFRERLLKTDETTCLADLLLKRLKKIEEKETENNITLNRNTIKKILTTNGIPENIINKLMLDMDQQSLEQTIRLPYTNSVSDIKERVEEEEKIL